MINCPKCGAEVSFDPEAAGPDGKVKVECGACGARFSVKVNRPSLKLGGTPAPSFARQPAAAEARPAPARKASGWDTLLGAVNLTRSSEEVPLLSTTDGLAGPFVPVGVVSHARLVSGDGLAGLADDPSLLHAPAHAHLRERARELKAQAVVGLRTQTIWRESTGDLLVVVEGTAVRFP